MLKLSQTLEINDIKAYDLVRLYAFLIFKEMSVIGQKQYTEFENQDYGVVIIELVRDIYYSGVSTSSKLVLIRKFTELISRKILNLGEGAEMTLGEIAYPNPKKFPRTYKLWEKLDVSFRDDFSKNVKEITELCNQYAHTQVITPASDEEYLRAEELVSELFSLLFVKYFTKFKLTVLSDSNVLTAFSHLPPVIRYKTLEKLMGEKEIYELNVRILDKFMLAKVKYQSLGEAFIWLLQNREEIIDVSYPTFEEIEDFIGLHNDECSLALWEYNNAFDLLLDKLLDPQILVNESGQLYDDFKRAVVYFNDFDCELYLTGTEEREEFKDLIEFAFLGR